MTLLEKLNLEAGASPRLFDRSRIILKLMEQNAPMGLIRMNCLTDYALQTKDTLTNAEFLAACEEWLKKN